MKSLKVLLMIAGFSTAIVASEGSADKAAVGYAQNVMNYLGSFGSYVTKKGSDFGTSVSTQASKCANETVKMAKSGYDTVATKTGEATTLVADYAQAGMSTVSTTAKNGVALGKSGVDSSVKFIQDNPKTVGIVATVATIAAAAAAYRKYTLGYVFYKSAPAKN